MKPAGATRVLVLQPDGAVIDIRSLIAADDAEAIAITQSMAGDHAVELWDGLRYIEHFAVVSWGS